LDLERIRQVVVERKLATMEMTHKMSHAELAQFLLLPGFTLRKTVSEISGRGIGLDVVHTMVQELGGNIRISSEKSQGTQFQLELPLSLSVIRALITEIDGEPFAFPLARIDRALKVPLTEIQTLEGRQHFKVDEEQIGLVTGSQILNWKSRTGDG